MEAFFAARLMQGVFQSLFLKIGPKIILDLHSKMRSRFVHEIMNLKLHFVFFLSGVGLGPTDFILFRLPLFRQLPFSIRIYFYVGVRLFLLFFIFKISMLFMDELRNAVAQFYPTLEGSGGLGGMNGGFNPPPVPDNSSILAAASPEAEDQPGSSHIAPSQGQGEVGEGQKRLLSVIERHLRAYCRSPAARREFPKVVDFKQDDFEYLSRKIYISELDCDVKSEVEIYDLALFLDNHPREFKPILRQSLQKDF